MAFIMAGTAVAGAVVSAGTAYADNKRAKSADKKASKFSWAQYQRWKGIYGDLEENLGKYYASLSPEKMSTRALTQYEAEYTRAKENIEAMFEVRGVEDSGFAMDQRKDMEIQRAVSRATIRTQAEDTVRQQQQSFLNVGLGKNPATGIASQLYANATNARTRADNSAAAVGQAIGLATYVGGSALSDHYAELEDNDYWQAAEALGVYVPQD